MISRQSATKLFCAILQNIKQINYYITKYKTYKFSVLIYSYIDASRNWKNEKLCGNTTAAGCHRNDTYTIYNVHNFYDLCKQGSKTDGLLCVC